MLLKARKSHDVGLFAVAVAADLVRALDPCPQDAAVEFVSAR